MIKIYSLRIVPNDSILNDIINFKNQIIQKFGVQPLSKSLPHITVATFLMDTNYENILIKQFSQLSEIPKFQLKVNGFDIFEGNSNTLYLKVLITPEIKELLQTKLKIIWIRDLHRKLSSLKISNNLHITISKLRNKQMLYESLNFFKDIDCHEIMNVESLLLTSRYNYKTWDWEHNIPLK